MKKIVLGGGCFWGMEAYFKRYDGVLKTEVGYANGHTILLRKMVVVGKVFVYGGGRFI